MFEFFVLVISILSVAIFYDWYQTGNVVGLQNRWARWSILTIVFLGACHLMVFLLFVFGSTDIQFTDNGLTIEYHSFFKLVRISDGIPVSR